MNLYQHSSFALRFSTDGLNQKLFLLNRALYQLLIQLWYSRIQFLFMLLNTQNMIQFVLEPSQPLIFLLLYIQLNKIMRQSEFANLKPNKHLFITPFMPQTHLFQEHSQKHYQDIQSSQNIQASNQQLERQLTIYDWRSRTQFPIVKICHLNVVQRKAKTAHLNVQTQKCCLKLKNCKDLPLFKVLYLLKQSIIGFERLYNRFGPFMVTSSMIVINSSYKCKVWLNQNYASNSFLSTKMNQSAFLLEVYRLFQQKSNSLKNTIQFYLQLHACKTFCSALAFIEHFTRQNKIVVSSSCKFTDREIVLGETSQNFDITSSLSLKKAQDFLPISGLRISLNTTVESPFKKGWMPKTGIQQTTPKNHLSDSNKNNKSEATGDGSYINSNSNIESSQNNDRNCGFDRQENKDTIYKSQLPINFSKPEKTKLNVRKCNSHAIDIKQFERLQFGTEKSNKGQEKSIKIKAKTKSYEFIDDQEDQQTTRQNIDNTFEKNQWNKRLTGLWQQEGELNHSIVNTQQKVKAKRAPIKLQLLGNISRNVYQSLINTDNKPFQEIQLHNNQY